MEGIICVTYRCNAHCHMCNIWKYPSKKEEEIKAKDLKSLPKVKNFNITGGEPFLRDDLDEIIEVLLPKTKRIVISTNGYFTDRIIKIAKKYPKIGIRVSLEGLPAANDELRGLKNGFDHALRTLLKLRNIGIKDIGFGITVSDRNAKDLMELYELSEAMNIEFATAVVHNTYYFHKYDNTIQYPDIIKEVFSNLIVRQLKSWKIKNWYRAYFNYGIINRIDGNKRLLPCTMGFNQFFIDPFGDLKPCNGLDLTMGNIKKSSFNEIWSSTNSIKIRKTINKCSMECWMIGSVSPAMKNNFWVPTKWIIKKKMGMI